MLLLAHGAGEDLVGMICTTAMLIAFIWILSQCIKNI